MRIPIVVGVTGHRDLRKQDIPAIQALVRSELQKLKDTYPHSPLVMLNSLAAGADLLCAEVAAEIGISLISPLPMPAEEYRRDFKDADLVRFDAMLQKATDSFVSPASEEEPSAMTRDFLYRQAGIYIALHSLVLLALWDGSLAKPGGCGTAEVVDYMRNRSCAAEYISFGATNSNAIIHILTPRNNADHKPGVSVKLVENEPGSLQEVFRLVDAFNAEDDAKRG